MDIWGKVFSAKGTINIVAIRMDRGWYVTGEARKSVADMERLSGRILGDEVTGVSGASDHVGPLKTL